jgi:hypothetical protein
LGFALELFNGRVGKLLDIVERKDSILTPQRALPPIFVHGLEDSDDVSLSELQFARF